MCFTPDPESKASNDTVTESDESVPLISVRFTAGDVLSIYNMNKFDPNDKTIE